jgi:long-chain acyl-CoA synthetase
MSSVTTLSELFLKVASLNKPDCLLHKVDGQYRAISTAELVDKVRRLGKALRDLGIERGERVALMAENGPHWPIVDFATLGIGGVLAPVYPTLTPDQATYIVRDCGARVVVCQTPKHLEGFLANSAELPSVEHYVLVQGQSADPRVMSLDSLIDRGTGVDPAWFEAEIRMAKPNDLATFIYTSGTTGNQKGVMLSHANVISNVVAADALLDLKPTYVGLSFLPLSHSFERTVDYVYFYMGCSIAYGEGVHAVAQNLGEVRPHLFVSVPRLYEKVMAKAQENASAGSPIKRRIFDWAVGVGREAIDYRIEGKTPPGLLGIKLRLADKLVFGKLRARLGGRFVMALSGGAPLSREVAEFFWGAGLPIYEGYGLSETSPVISVNVPGAARLGTVGRPIPGVEVHIADDGEILARGPNIMLGYWNLPEATAEAIDQDGWFHTGDIGEVDKDGYLRITDRKKELIVNAYGKNVAPAPIENDLKSASPYISQAVVIGDRRKFLSALLVPEMETLKAWAAKNGIGTADHAGLIADPKVRALYKKAIETVNAKHPSFEQIVAWDVLPDEWSIETGEITPTLKVKRRVINQKYGAAIDRLYQQADKHGGG